MYIHERETHIMVDPPPHTIITSSIALFPFLTCRSYQSYHFYLKDKYLDLGSNSFLWRATVYAIVNDRLSALELAITPDKGHGGPMTSRLVTFMSILCLHRVFIYISKYWNTIKIHLRPNSKLGYLSFKQYSISKLIWHQAYKPIISPLLLLFSISKT